MHSSVTDCSSLSRIKAYFAKIRTKTRYVLGLGDGTNMSAISDKPDLVEINGLICIRHKTFSVSAATGLEAPNETQILNHLRAQSRL